jgi:hypothetical protein
LYAHCIYCQSALGSNETIESFPVARRLAFDAEKGRLWAVCPACRRWNLAPFEQRWEALEECERRFRDARLRMSTENVGLARVAEGTELIRVGRPERPELAGWRYGAEMGARRRRTLAYGAAGIAAAGGVLAAATGLASFVALGPVLAPLVVGAAGNLVFTRVHALRTGGPVWPPGGVRVQGDDGTPIDIPGYVWRVMVRPEASAPDGWELSLTASEDEAGEQGRVHHALHGRAAMAVAGVFLAGANRRHGTRRDLRGALVEVEAAGTPARYFAAAERRARMRGQGGRSLWELPVEIRLAMEMLLHEDDERRALEGELKELERRWRDAEEIAAIADRLAIAPGDDAPPSDGSKPDR